MEKQERNAKGQPERFVGWREKTSRQTRRTTEVILQEKRKKTKYKKSDEKGKYQGDVHQRKGGCPRKEIRSQRCREAERKIFPKEKKKAGGGTQAEESLLQPVRYRGRTKKLQRRDEKKGNEAPRTASGGNTRGPV